ncbi:MAG: hypothetical protein J0L91_08660 [Burkholderiales bacterium]|nr:hypothetical protein [Burkholderiales bacterium]MCC7116040.1 hypothetical protein [Burkholderiales bacterium]
MNPILIVFCWPYAGRPTAARQATAADVRMKVLRLLDIATSHVGAPDRSGRALSVRHAVVAARDWSRPRGSHEITEFRISEIFFGFWILVVQLRAVKASQQQSAETGARGWRAVHGGTWDGAASHRRATLNPVRHRRCVDGGVDAKNATSP